MIQSWLLQLRIWAHLTLLLCGVLAIGLIIYTQVFSADLVLRVPSVERTCREK